MVRMHAECKQRSFLVRGGKKSPTQNLRNYFPGMVVDRAMMEWLARPDHEAGWMVDRVETLTHTLAAEEADSGNGQVRWRDLGDRAEVAAFCRELVGRLEPILREHVLPYPHTAAKRFKVPMTLPYLDGSKTKILLTGEMDLQVRQPDGWVVWDLKGTKDNDYWRKVTGQLVFYDLVTLCQEGEGTRKVGLIQPMCKLPKREFKVTGQARLELMARIQRYCVDAWREVATPTTDHNRCGFCDVKHACVQYAPIDPDSLAFGLIHNASRKIGAAR